MGLINDPHNDLTEKIIGCAFTVSNELGCGFLEKVYENAMVVALNQVGLVPEQQAPYKVLFQNMVVGEYFADLLVNNTVLVEIKAVKELDDIHAAQCINYLHASGLPVCLLFNFAKSRVEFKRYFGRKKQASTLGG